MDCASFLTGGGEVHVQLLHALGATSNPPSGGSASHNIDPGGFISGRPPFNGIVRDHPRPPGRGVKSVRFRVVIPLLRG